MACKNHLLFLGALAALTFPLLPGGPSRSGQGSPAASATALATAQAAVVPKKAPTAAITGANPNASLSDAAWRLLTQGVKSDKSRDRSDALSALTVLDSDQKAISFMENALGDKQESIRVLAAVSLGDMKARPAIPQLKKALDDPSPQVSFAAAKALWKMGDRSGADILYEILNGDRPAQPGLIKSKITEARDDMHDPKALALIGINEASGALLGPFSMGVSVLEEYARNSGAPVQALCAQLLASDDSARTAEVLTDALGDRNWSVRAAAARALAKLDDRRAMPQLKDMMENDKSQPARYAAAAAIIHLSRRFPTTAS